MPTSDFLVRLWEGCRIDGLQTFQAQITGTSLRRNPWWVQGLAYITERQGYKLTLPSRNKKRPTSFWPQYVDSGFTIQMPGHEPMGVETLVLEVQRPLLRSCPRRQLSSIHAQLSVAAFSRICEMACKNNMDQSFRYLDAKMHSTQMILRTTW